MPRNHPNETLSGVAAQLARRWANQRLAAVQNYGRILSDYGQGRATSGATVSAFAKLAVEEAARYSADAVGIATDYAAAVAGRVGLDAAMDDVHSGLSTVVKDLELSGTLDGEANSEFYLANPFETSVAVSFATSRFTGPNGEVATRPTLHPAEVLLPGHQEHRIAVRAVLDSREFKAGETYSAHVAVTGFDHMMVRIHLTVLEPL